MEKPTEDEKRFYWEYRRELDTRQLSNSENYDKAILSTSSALLAGSLVFLNYIAGSKVIGNLCILVISWSLFAAAIISTLLSFRISQGALTLGLSYAGEKFLLHKSEGELKDLKEQMDRKRRNTRISNLLSGIFFVTAIVLLMLFFAMNILGV